MSSAAAAAGVFANAAVKAGASEALFACLPLDLACTWKAATRITSNCSDETLVRFFDVRWAEAALAAVTSKPQLDCGARTAAARFLGNCMVRGASCRERLLSCGAIKALVPALLAVPPPPRPPPLSLPSSAGSSACEAGGTEDDSCREFHKAVLHAISVLITPLKPYENFALVANAYAGQIDIVGGPANSEELVAAGGIEAVCEVMKKHAGRLDTQVRRGCCAFPYAINQFHRVSPSEEPATSCTAACPG